MKKRLASLLFGLGAVLCVNAMAVPVYANENVSEMNVAKEEVDAIDEDPDEDGEENSTFLEQNDESNDEIVTATAQTEDDALLNAKDEILIPEEDTEASKYVFQYGGLSVKPKSDNKGSLGGSGTSVNWDTVYDYVAECLKNRQTEISMSQFRIKIDSSTYPKKLIDDPSRDIHSFLRDTINENPEYYDVSYLTYTTYDNYLSKYEITYKSGFDDALFEENTRKALATIKPGMTDVQKAIALHDYLCLNVEYAKKELDAKTLSSIPNVYNAYGAIAEGYAVCNGYALAYKYLLSKVGIEAYMVTSESMNHAWNLIKLNGEYYQVDTTWDDPTWDMIGRARHFYMFLSDNAFSDTNHKHRDWVVVSRYDNSGLKATDTTYDNAYWSNVNSALVYKDNNYYFTKFNNEYPPYNYIYGIQADSIAAGDVFSINNSRIDVWRVIGTSYYYTSSYSNLYDINGRLYFNTPTGIDSINYDGTDRKNEMTVELSDEYVYGSVYRDGEILFTIESTPSIAARQTIYAADIEGISQPEEISKVMLDSISLDLGGLIGINVYMKVPASIASDLGAYVMAGDESMLISTLPKDNVTGLYKATVKVPAKDIRKGIMFRVFDGRGQLVDITNSEGADITDDEYMLAVVNYIDEVVNGSYSDIDKEIAATIYNYGSYAKSYFTGVDYSDYWGFGDEMAQISSTSLSDCGKIVSGDCTGIKLSGTSLMLKGNTSIRHYFELDDGYNISDYSFVVNGDILEPINSGNMYYVEFGNIGANELDEYSIVTVRNKWTGKTMSIKFSPFSYAKMVLDNESSNEKLVDLVRAMVLYNRAVKNAG